MIVKHINNNTGIVPVFWGQPRFTLLDNRVVVGKRIDCSVKKDTNCNFSVIVCQGSFSFYKISYEVPNQDFLIVARKVKMCEEVHV